MSAPQEAEQEGRELRASTGLPLLGAPRAGLAQFELPASPPPENHVALETGKRVDHCRALIAVGQPIPPLR